MLSMFLSSYGNTCESFGKLKKAVENITRLRLIIPQPFSFYQLPFEYMFSISEVMYLYDIKYKPFSILMVCQCHVQSGNMWLCILPHFTFLTSYLSYPCSPGSIGSSKHCIVTWQWPLALLKI